jgi:cell division protein FtsB
MRRAVRVLLGVVTIAAVLFLFVFPVRTLIEQHRQTSQAQQRVKALGAANAQLNKQVGELQNPNYIAGIARQRFGLAAPGDHAYIVLPAPATTTTTTAPPVTAAPPTTAVPGSTAPGSTAPGSAPAATATTAPPSPSGSIGG